MVSRDLVTRDQAAEVIPPQHRALTIVRSGSVPKVISEGILDLMTVFAAKDEADTDKKRLMRVYAEAVEEFDESVVAAVLRHLKFHNPRNPWRPTPQDLYEGCKRTMGAWKRKVVDHFLGAKDPNAEQVVDREIGGVPLTPECVVPDAMVIKFLKDHLGRRPDSYCGDVFQQLRNLTLARLNAIPAECFRPGQREDAVAAIENRRRVEALLTSLAVDLRFEADRVISRHGGEYKCSLPNEEIIRLARSELELQERVRRAETLRLHQRLRSSD